MAPTVDVAVVVATKAEVREAAVVARVAVHKAEANNKLLWMSEQQEQHIDTSKPAQAAPVTCSGSMRSRDRGSG